jgi:thiazole synthase
VDTFKIADKTFSSRLIVGTGKYASPAVMVQAHEASGAEMVTVAVRRVNISDRSKESLLDYIDTAKYFLLPNTAGCYTADEAIRTARLGREAGLSNWVKLEVIGDERTLFPDNTELLEATRVLVREGFVVLPYTSDDPEICRKLEDAGAAAVMPLGAPIGSGLGIQNANNIRIIREFARVPLIVDAGVGTASDAALAMELGADAVLMNTAIAGAQNPVAMAEAMKLAGRAGRLAYGSGRIARRMYANASSPVEAGRPLITQMPGPDDLAALKAERGRRTANTTTRSRGSIRRFNSCRPTSLTRRRFPTSTRSPLNTLWKIDPPRPRGLAAGSSRRSAAVAPLFRQQQAFNSAVVDHVNQDVQVARQSREAWRRRWTSFAAIEDLIRFQSLLVLFAQRSRPTSIRAIATSPELLRGLSGAINSVADELMKRSDAMLTRDRRHEISLNDLEARLAALQKQLLEVQRGIEESNRT